jgi:hypothetical protein
VDEPEQTEPLPVMVEEGSEFTVSDLLELLEQPFWSLTVTVKVPAEATVTHCVVAPVLQR